MFEYHSSRSALGKTLANLSGNSTGITFKVLKLFYIKLHAENYGSKLALIWICNYAKSSIQDIF